MKVDDRSRKGGQARDGAALDAADPPAEFQAIDFLTFDKNDVATTKLDRDCADFTHLVNHPVIVDGVEFFCVGVQYPNPGPPYQKGEHIALTLRSAKS